MNSYKKVKDDILRESSDIMRMAAQDLNELDDYKDKSSSFYGERLKKCKDTVISCQNEINNLDECATIEIGYSANEIINAIQSVYEFNPDEYASDFEGAIDRNIFGKGDSKNGNVIVHYGKHECDTLGIDTSDLLCFKGKNPMDDEVCDHFRSIVNENYGTNIPMSGVVAEAEKHYDDVKSSGDEVSTAKAFVQFKELQRDAGVLKNDNDGMFILLGTIKEYQDAKALCGGRSK